MLTPQEKENALFTLQCIVENLRVLGVTEAEIEMAVSIREEVAA